ncbi:Co/Zn/Cd efflux system component [Paramagnetospirillum caucaseum]|uniref:Co/Zn/Cd efflux system component n=1 Tax=Paramagnetospirillum caucaseum TaxID=1244869 RepID=M2Y795_9PROT|nr:CDF family Co(II)/Ni(II) efflux transporter DmeF [Paramagnetospirillum caucaseum]EME68931.1 Co/Zn/Cd efflux system component [Paramagnetospirillum caucaseum]
MHIHCMDSYRHPHADSAVSDRSERRVRLVLILTVLCMAGEIAAGWAFGSLALLADGWHMASHGAAMTIALFAYAFARRHAADPAFTFGTGKVNALAGFTSAIVLGVVAVMMVWEAAQRLLTPVAVSYGEAMAVAVIGLAVNLASVLILDPPGGHGHEDGHDHHAHGHDHNLRAATLHVMADLLTSVGAIAALGAGMMASWDWLDPAMGLVGAAVIGWWARGLIRDTARVLLDKAENPALAGEIRALIEADADNRVADLHVWAIRPGHLAAIVSVVTHYPRDPEHYKELLAAIPALDHVTVEVIGHGGEPCLPVGDQPGTSVP